jgi:hypothetical protein
MKYFNLYMRSGEPEVSDEFKSDGERIIAAREHQFSHHPGWDYVFRLTLDHNGNPVVSEYTTYDIEGENGEFQGMIDEQCRDMEELAADEYTDFEVVGIDSDGHVVQWSTELGSTYTSGETLEEFGIENLFPHELARLGLTTE